MGDAATQEIKDAVLYHMGYPVKGGQKKLVEGTHEAVAAEIGGLLTASDVSKWVEKHPAPMQALVARVKAAKSSAPTTAWHAIQDLVAKNIRGSYSDLSRQASQLADTLKPYFVTRLIGDVRSDWEGTTHQVITSLAGASSSSVNWLERMQKALNAEQDSEVKFTASADYLEIQSALETCQAALQEAEPSAEKALTQLMQTLSGINKRHHGGYASQAIKAMEEVVRKPVLKSDYVFKDGKNSGSAQRIIEDTLKAVSEKYTLASSAAQRNQQQAQRAEEMKKRRRDAVVAGKYDAQQNGWGYFDSVDEAQQCAETLHGRGHIVGNVWVVSDKQEDPFSPTKEHEEVAWAQIEIDDTTIEVPGTDCKSIKDYMVHAKAKFAEEAWTLENQQAVFAHAMVCVAADCGQQFGTEYAGACQYYVDTAGDKPWVITPEVRQALGLHEQFNLDAAKRDAFEQMHEAETCRFMQPVTDVEPAGDTAGLREAGSELSRKKHQRYPQFQERMWQQFWREFGQGKVAYLEGEDGRPVVKCGADGAAVVYVGQKDFMSVTAQGGQKSNGIKSDAEAEALVRGILMQRKIKGTDNRKPLVAYGKHTKDILRIVKACIKYGLRVRLGSDAVSQRALKQLSLKDRQEVEGHMAYSDVKGQASIGKDGATPVKAISGQGGKSPEPQPGVA